MRMPFTLKKFIQCSILVRCDVFNQTSFLLKLANRGNRVERMNFHLAFIFLKEAAPTLKMNFPLIFPSSCIREDLSLVLFRFIPPLFPFCSLLSPLFQARRK